MGRVAGSVDNSMIESFMQRKLLDSRRWKTKTALASVVLSV